MRPSLDAFSGEDMEVSVNESIKLNAEDINVEAVYRWYDENNTLIHTGIDFSILPEMVETYKLEVIANIDGFKDYDEISISIKQPEIISIVPNPVLQSTDILINYNAQNTSSIYLVLAPITGNFYDYYILDVNQNEKSINTNNYGFGLYVLSLVSDGQVVDQKTFVIE